MTQLRKAAFINFGILVCCVFSLKVTYGQLAGQQPDSGQTVRIDTTLVSVPVVVSDRQGRYVSGPKASDFTLYEDNVKQPVDFFADTEEPISVALLLDT